MEEAANVGFAVSPSSIPKNYVSLRQLRDLRLKEKQDEEERLRNQNLHLNREQQHQTEGKRLEEDSFPYPNLNPTKEGRNKEGEPKPHPKPPASRYDRSPIGFRAVARAEPARRPADDGPEANALGSDLNRVIGDAAGDPHPQIGRVCSQTRKAEKKKKKGKGNGGKPERSAAMPAAVYVNPKEVSLVNAIQVKEGAGLDCPENVKQKPAGLQCSGSELMMQMEQQSVNGSSIPTAFEAGRSWPSSPRGGRCIPKPGRGGIVGRGKSMVEAAAGNPRPGRGGPVAVHARPVRGGVVSRGRSMVGADAGLVWVKKTAGS